MHAKMQRNLGQIFIVRYSLYTEAYLESCQTFKIELFVKTVHGSEAFTRKCSVKKVLLEILQNLQESTCARVSFLTKLLDLF